MLKEEKLSSIIDYIIEKYHKSIRENLPKLEIETKKLVQDFGEKYIELVQIAELLKQHKVEIDEHIKKEEEDFFSLIKKIEENNLVYDCDLVILDSFIKKLEIEHEHFDTYVYYLFEIYKTSGLKYENEEVYNKFFDYFSSLESETKEHTKIENQKLHPLVRDKIRNLCKK